MTDRELLEEIQARITSHFVGAEPAPDPVKTVHVAIGEDIQAAFNALLDTGGVLAAEPGVHRGRLVVPERPLNAKAIRVRTGGLPLAGEWLARESHLPVLAAIASPDGSPTVSYAPRARQVFFEEIALVGGARDGTVVRIGHDKFLTPDEQPEDLGFDKVLVVGHEQGSLRAFDVAGRRVSWRGVTTRNIFSPNKDSQAIAAWNGGHQLVIEDSDLEAAGENILFGGSTCRDPLMIPGQIVIRRVRLGKAYERWLALPTPPIIKCNFEVKNVKGLVLDEVLVEKNGPRNWAAAPGIVLKCANQYGTDPWTTCENVLIQNTIIRDVGSAFSIVGYGDSGRPTQRMKNVVIRNVLGYNLDPDGTPYQGTGRLFPIANPPDGLTVDHCTFIANKHSFMQHWFDQGQPKGSSLAWTSTIANEGSYGYHSPAGLGNTAIADGWMSYTFAGSAFGRGDRPFVPTPGGVLLSVADIEASLDPENCFAVRSGSVLASMVTPDGLPIGIDPTKLHPILRRWQ